MKKQKLIAPLPVKNFGIGGAGSILGWHRYHWSAANADDIYQKSEKNADKVQHLAMGMDDNLLFRKLRLSPLVGDYSYTPLGARRDFRTEWSNWLPLA